MFFSVSEGVSIASDSSDMAEAEAGRDAGHEDIVIKLVKRGYRTSSMKFV